MYFNRNILILYAIALVVVASFINYFFVAILIFYFTFVVLLYSRPKITTGIKHLYLYIGYIYPAVGLFMRYLLETRYSTFYMLNRVEHSLFSLILTIILYIIFFETVKKLKLFEQAIFVMGIVIIFGNSNEIFEFIIRPFITIDYGLKQTLFYSDTILDLVMNLIGTMLGFIISKRIIKE